MRDLGCDYLDPGKRVDDDVLLAGYMVDVRREL